MHKEYFSSIKSVKNMSDKKVYIGSGFTANNHIVKGLGYELYTKGLDLEVVAGSFNRFYEDLIFQDNEYEYIVLIESAIQLLINQGLEEGLSSFKKKVIEIIKKNDKSTIIIPTLEKLPFRIFGNMDAVLEEGSNYKIEEFNMWIKKTVKNQSNVKLLDIDYISSYIGLKKYFDIKYITMFSYGTSLEGQYEIVMNIVNILNSDMGNSKKVLITDLDNTLWPGIIGDDGIEEINQKLIKKKDFKIYHHTLKALSDSGVFIAIASKNNNDVEEKLKEVNIEPLKNEDFLISEINWDRKSINIEKITSAFNVSQNSVVFIDDNAREIEEVKQSLYEVETVQFKDAIQSIQNLTNKGYFEKVNLTDVDKNRTKSFKKTKELMNSIGSYDEYLKNLEIKIEIEELNEKNKDRVVQLLNKTNQFNNFKEVITLKKIDELKENGYKIDAVSYEDKLGKEGIVSVIVWKENEEVEVLNWVLSCRVFKRGIERKILNYLPNKEKRMRLKKTDRNAYLTEVLSNEKIYMEEEK